jgi:hypothetical protein
MNALIDTGASQTAITPHRIQALRPQPVGKESFIRPDGQVIQKTTYAVRLAFEPNTSVPLWPLTVRWFDAVVVSVAPATPGVDVLIGQDILSELVLSWDGPRGRLLLLY